MMICGLVKNHLKQAYASYHSGKEWWTASSYSMFYYGYSAVHSAAASDGRSCSMDALARVISFAFFSNQIK